MIFTLSSAQTCVYHVIWRHVTKCWRIFLMSRGNVTTVYRVLSSAVEDIEQTLPCTYHSHSAEWMLLPLQIFLLKKKWVKSLANLPQLTQLLYTCPSEDWNTSLKTSDTSQASWWRANNDRSVYRLQQSFFQLRWNSHSIKETVLKWTVVALRALTVLWGRLHYLVPRHLHHRKY